MRVRGSVVPVEFLSDDQVATYGRFLGEPTRAERSCSSSWMTLDRDLKRYAERQATQWEHTSEIRQAFGYRDVTEATAAASADGELPYRLVELLRVPRGTVL